MAVETGTYVMGVKQTLKKLRDGSARMVVVASGRVAEDVSSLVGEARSKSVRVYEFPGSGWDLAALCARGHVVSAIGIIDPGESDILKKS
ncbi:MAG: 50S ribosomal protein L30e [Candidatus Marsarchaeota archaeon]|nr:50S ribosomal protein L30e [Candidatus Marsarchaeota archaeon]